VGSNMDNTHMQGSEQIELSCVSMPLIKFWHIHYQFCSLEKGRKRWLTMDIHRPIPHKDGKLFTYRTIEIELLKNRIGRQIHCNDFHFHQSNFTP